MMKKILIVFTFILLSLGRFTDVNALNLTAVSPRTKSTDEVYTRIIEDRIMNPITARNLKQIDYSLENYIPINEVDSFNNIVIFVRFADETEYDAPYSKSHYGDMFNGVNQVSLRDYFLEASYNKLEINSYLVAEENNIIYYTDEFERGYYEPYDAATNPIGYSEESRDTREHELLKSAIDYVDENNLVPSYLNLDMNNDGDIDSITFMVSGEDNGWNELLWPHKWEMTSYYDYDYGEYYDYAPMINDKYAYTYTFELLGDSTEYDNQVNVGVLAHETFHLISAPDLYHYYAYDWIEPVGSWGLMENNGITPSHMLGYMKEKYGGWISDTQEITENGTYTLYPLQDSGNNLYKIYTGVGNEYIYLEYRDLDGLYESSLEGTGLLVYRVNLDYLNYGNEEGYYNDQNISNDEVFIYRPNLYDETYPIEFESENQDYIDEDGDIEKAILSQNSFHDEIGKGTDIFMFDSQGNEIDLLIENVTLQDGFLTFDVKFQETQINLFTYFDNFDDENVVLLDLDNTAYSVVINDIPEGVDAYYTVDGTTPSQESLKYFGEQIIITPLNPTVKVRLYENGAYINKIERTFEFSNKIVTEHNFITSIESKDYWYLNFTKLSNYDLVFDEFFDLGFQYDRLTIYHHKVEPDLFGHGDLKSETLNYINKGILIEYTKTRQTLPIYGFEANINLNEQFDDLYYYLNGDSSIETNLFSTYTDPGLVLEGIEDHFYEMSSNVDVNVVGEYQVTYSVYNGSNELIGSIVRTVNVVDIDEPHIWLEGEPIVDILLGEEYVESGYRYTDNYDDDLTAIVLGEVDSNIPGSYHLEYYIIDTSGNRSNIITRVVNVIDSIAPYATLVPSVDTIFTGEAYYDKGIIASDNYSDGIEITTDNQVNSQLPGVYKITYTVSDFSGNQVIITRFVNVLEKAETVEVTFECLDSVSTYTKGDEIVSPFCKINGDTNLEYDLSYVNNELAGTYPVYVSKDINGIKHTFKTYVFIGDKNQSGETLYTTRRKNWL